MRTSTLQSVLGNLRKLTDPARTRELSDADLLERFRIGREDAAFTLLVQRHGPMVFGICRRLLGDVHEAEDAFQAVFLVLARNAGTIRQQQSLGGWLHGVATRIARKARLRTARRHARERDVVPPCTLVDPADALAALEMRAALDEEIARLPDKYRTPLILCYLTERTHEQAARELGWPKSSVTARLARARQLLHQRLTRRGFAVPLGLLAVLLTEQANAAVSSPLALSTVRLAGRALRGEALVATATTALANTFATGTAVKWTAALTLLATMGLAAAVGHRLSLVGSPSSHEEVAPKAQPIGDRRAAKADARKPRVDLLGDPLPDGVVARIGSGRMRHPGLRALAFSPDGKSLASGSDSDLRVWDAADGKLQRRMEALGGPFVVGSGWALALAYRRDGLVRALLEPKKRIVTVHFINPIAGNVRRRIAMKEQAAADLLALTPDGGRVAFPLPKAIGLFDTSSGERTSRIDVPEGFVRAMAFAPDGKTLALVPKADTIRIHDASSGKIVRELRREGDTIINLICSPDGRSLASATWDSKSRTGEMSIWDVATGAERHRLKPLSHYVHWAAFSPDGKYVAAGVPFAGVVLWDVAAGKEVRRFAGDGVSSSIAFAPDGKSLAAVGGDSIRLWDVESGRALPASADPFLGFIWGVRFDAEGKRLVGEGMERWFAWDPATGRELQRFPKTQDHAWSLSPDESLLASADRMDEIIRVRDARTGREVRALRGHTKPVFDVVFSPDGRQLISTGWDATIRVWDVASGREVRRLDSPGNRHLAISPDGRWLASANNRNGPNSGYEVLLWDLTTGREMRRWALATRSLYVLQLRFSPDSRLLVAAGGGGVQEGPAEVKLWNVADGKLLRAFAGHNKHVYGVAFSPDGRTLATSDTGGVLFLWELASGRRRHAFAGHESGINALAFSPDGRLLAASSADAPIFVWDVMGILLPARRPLAEEQLRRCWSDLANVDAAAAFQAMRRLQAASEQTLPFVRAHLKPVPAPDLTHTKQLIKALDSDAFAERQKAAEELEKCADAAAAELRKAAKESSSLYVRRTLQQMLDGLETAPEALRAVRAVEVLEWLATPDAMRLLDELTKGAADARLTREAATARERLRKLPR